MAIYIHGFWYDISNFKHPGGTVIKHYANNDATEAFDSFHFRSSRAKKILNSLPKLELNTVPSLENYEKIDNNIEMLQDFNIWKQSLIDRGFFKPSYIHVTYRLSELIGIFSLATYMVYNNQLLLSLLLYGLFSGRCGWVQHECGHTSFTCNKYYDKIIQKITIGFGLSTSGTVWNKMHNRHHASTQKENFDMDLDTLPFVAFYNDAINNNECRFINSYWIKYQAYNFILITSGIFVMIFWIFILHPINVIKNKDIFEGSLMLSSHIIHTYIFQNALNCSYLFAYFYFIITKWLAGIYLFGHFSTSHTFTKTVKQDTFPTWVDYALYHTVDINTQNIFVSWIMGYLNCQCVHHLFPQMPQFRQPIVSKELELFAKKWNKPYIHVSYFEAWYKTFQNLNNVGKSIYHKLHTAHDTTHS
jgi:fatty acid desaturase 2 (delta-6 desaturase)